jgi:hypothetical protein
MIDKDPAVTVPVASRAMSNNQNSTGLLYPGTDGNRSPVEI